MSEIIEELSERWGEPTHRVEADGERLARFAGHVPADVIDLWRRFGFSGFRDGLIWLCDPAVWQPAADAWTGEIDDQAGSWLPVARSAFGTLILCGRGTGRLLTVLPHFGLLVPAASPAASPVGVPDPAVAAYLAGSDPADFDLEDESGDAVFEAARRRCGALGAEQIYTFAPLLALGGAVSADTVAVEDGPSQLQLLAEIIDPMLLPDAGQLLGRN